MSRMAIPQCKRVIHQLLVATFILAGSGSLSWAAEPAPPNTPGPFVEETEAWAMLVQMMSRLRTAVAKGEFTLIDPEDPVASEAVSSMLNELAKTPTPQRGL